MRVQKDFCANYQHLVEMHNFLCVLRGTGETQVYYISTCCTPFTVEIISCVTEGRQIMRSALGPNVGPQDRPWRVRKIHPASPSVRPSVCSARVRGITRIHARTRSLGSVANRAPGPPPFFFPIQTRLSYISCSTPEFQPWHFTLSSLREMTFPAPPSLFPAPGFVPRNGARGTT